MRVTPIEHGLDLQKSDLVRSPGLHASDIYGDLYQDLEPKRFVRGSKPNAVLMALGSAWENHLEKLLILNGVQAERPEEMLSPEGLFAFSPDLLICNGVARLGEIKFSTMGVKDLPKRAGGNFPPKFDKYMCQMMLYCHSMNMSKARLYFCTTRGADGMPDLLVWDIEFTARELQDNYNMIINHAKHKGML